MNIIKNTSIFLFSLFFVASCGQKNKNTKNDKKIVTKHKRKSLKIKTVRFAVLFRDYKGIPVPLLPSETGSYEVEYNNDNSIKLIKRLDAEQKTFQQWNFIKTSKKRIKEIKFSDLTAGTSEKLELIIPTGSGECAVSYSELNLKTGKKCFKVGKNQIKEFIYNAEDKLIEKADVLIDKNRIPVKKITYTKFGEKKSVEYFNIKITSANLTLIYKKFFPAGALAAWTETEYNAQGQKIRMTAKYEDGVLRSETTYKYTNKYNAEGTAITEEGIKYRLKVTTDHLGHRLSEKRFLGIRLVYEEKSKYNNKGKLINRVIFENNKKVSETKIKYNKNNLPVEKHLYSGNNYTLVCQNRKKGAYVTTPLPALETARITYDTLGRVISIERFYLDKRVDKEELVYTPKNQIASKTLYIGESKEPVSQTYVYDKRGNISEERSYRKGNLTEIIKYKWDVRGLLVEKKMLKPDGTAPNVKEAPSGSIIKYFYNEDGQLKEERHLHSDGKPALSVQFQSCISCKNGKSRAVSKILRTYKNNLLVKSEEYGANNKKIYVSVWKYDQKGRPVYHEETRFPEQKTKKEIITYAKGGWTSSIKHSVYHKNKLLTAEERLFDKAKLIAIKKYKKDTLVYEVTRAYKNGFLWKRSVHKFGKPKIIETIKRDSSGNPVKSTVTNEQGKPATNIDIFNNKYSSLFYKYNDKGLITLVIRRDDPSKLITKTEFFYDKLFRPVGRKVYKAGKLRLEIKEEFNHPLLGAYGIATLQTRVSINTKGKRKVSMYKIFPDTKYIDKSYAEITGTDGKKVKLNECKCKGCGVTMSLEDFMQISFEY